MWSPGVPSRGQLCVALLPLLTVVILGCGGSATTSVTGPSATKCQISITNDASEVPASGGNGTLTVSSARECTWSARADAAWITLTPATGQGPTTVNYSVQPNPNGSSRRGHVVVSDRTVEVVQAAAACRYTVSPSDAATDAAAEELAVVLTATPDCRWTARSEAPWITPAPRDGVGSATVHVTIAANTAQPRVGTVTIGTAAVNVNQAAAVLQAPRPPPPMPSPSPNPTPTPAPTPGCSYAASPTRISIDAAGGPASIGVTTQSECAWTATITASWIAFASASTGTGSGSLSLTIGDNAGTARTATITVAGQTVTVEQAARVATACTYHLGDAGRPITSEPQDLTVAMSAPAGCPWTVSSDAPWMTLADAGPGSGNGSFRIRVAANAGEARAGTVRAASETLIVQQAANACTYAIKPNYYNAGRGPDTVTIMVTAGAGCAWTAESHATWATVDAGTMGSGNGPVRLQVQPNSAAARTALATIAGQAFTLHQEGQCSYSIKPTSYHAGHGPDDITLTVSTDAGCTWTASSSVSWVTIAEGSSGSGNGTVRLLVRPNDGPARSITLSIAGQPFDLRQDGRD